MVVAKSQLEAARKQQCPAGQVACGPCAREEIDPLAPILKAACIDKRCAFLDLRAAALSECKADADCKAVGQGCCPPYSDDPSEYVALRPDADAGVLACFPIPPCVPPQAHGEPIAYCASDAHCAVRRREMASGKASSTCYSPTQNLERAYEPAAVGCDCPQESAPLCRSDATGRKVALLCGDDARWVAVEDGPCAQVKP